MQRRKRAIRGVPFLEAEGDQSQRREHSPHSAFVKVRFIIKEHWSIIIYYRLITVNLLGLSTPLP